MNKLDALKNFAKVVEMNSFSAAARDLGVSRSSISKSVSQLYPGGLFNGKSSIVFYRDVYVHL